MTFTFRPARRENVGLIIGLAAASGGGKTYTAMRLATGMSGGKPFAVIDTEAGRAKHYADKFRFDHGDLKAPFSPEAYSEAISAADEAGYPVIVVDSFSHEWAGEGGVLDMQEREFKRLGEREQAKMASWIAPKREHKLMVQKLLQCRAHLILCLRAEEKIDMVRVDGKMQVVPKQGPGGFKGWLPICEKNLPFELIVSLLFLPEAPGVPVPIKPLPEQFKGVILPDRQMNEAIGTVMAAWASGGTEAKFITQNQALDLETMCRDHEIPLENLRRAARVDRLTDIRDADYDRAKAWVSAAIAKRTGDQA